ncbi:MAG TPA: uroporphyrinogen-III synthase [Candidatus Angelobacter sp.]|nr:uroporphyrinogen-III synthase [Candidatus Angelobacter sp.]
MNSGEQEKSLAGWRILTTRARKQAGGLAQPLRELGAEVIEIPTIEIKPPHSYSALDSALKNIAEYDWLILTSVNGVEALWARLKKLRIPTTKLSNLKIAAIGPATRREIEQQGLRVSVTPEKYVAEAVVEALRGKTEGKRVLLVRAKIARDVLPNQLRKAGAKVEVVEAYETQVPKGAQARLNSIFAREESCPDIVTFTSSSTATNFLDLLAKEHYASLRDIHLASIGPVTSATLTKAGFAPRIEAREYTMQGLVAAIAEHVRNEHR